MRRTLSSKEAVVNFVPLGKQGVGRVKDHGGKLATILVAFGAYMWWSDRER